MKHGNLLIVLCVLFGFSSFAQSTTTVEKNAKRITITTKKVDESGKTITETYIAEGDEPAKILEGMAINPEIIQKVDVSNIETKSGERLFLYRQAGDKMTIEGTLAEDVEAAPNAENIVEKVVIIHSGSGANVNSYKVAPHAGRAHAGVWVKGPESKINCAALGVFVHSVPDGGGSKINSVIESGGAQAAGMKEGDVIVKIDEFEINDFATLHLALSHFKPGEIVTVRFVREGKTEKSRVELKDWAELPGHEWRSRSDCGKEIIAEKPVDNILRDDPPGLSNIQPLELQDALIFPNPTEGLFAFSFTTNAGPISVSITDVNGKVVYQENNDNPTGFYKKEIDLKGVPQGNYIVSVTQGDKVFTEQISKQ